MVFCDGCPVIRVLDSTLVRLRLDPRLVPVVVLAVGNVAPFLVVIVGVTNANVGGFIAGARNQIKTAPWQDLREPGDLLSEGMAFVRCSDGPSGDISCTS